MTNEINPDIFESIEEDPELHALAAHLEETDSHAQADPVFRKMLQDELLKIVAEHITKMEKGNPSQGDLYKL